MANPSLNFIKLYGRYQSIRSKYDVGNRVERIRVPMSMCKCHLCFPDTTEAVRCYGRKTTTGVSTGQMFAETDQDVFAAIESLVPRNEKGVKVSWRSPVC